MIRLLVFTVLLQFSVSLSAWAGSQFFETLYDVPIMPQIKELPGHAISFDQPEGRIAEAAAATHQSFEQVKIFYKIALKQMGWSLQRENAENLSFHRKGEILEISHDKSMTSAESGEIVVFRLAPLPK